MSDAEKEKAGADNYANQLNPHHVAYHLARGLSPAAAEHAAAAARAAKPTSTP